MAYYFRIPNRSLVRKAHVSAIFRTKPIPVPLSAGEMTKSSRSHTIKTLQIRLNPAPHAKITYFTSSEKLRSILYATIIDCCEPCKNWNNHRSSTSKGWTWKDPERLWKEPGRIQISDDVDLAILSNSRIAGPTLPLPSQRPGLQLQVYIYRPHYCPQAFH